MQFGPAVNILVFVQDLLHLCAHVVDLLHRPRGVQEVQLIGANLRVGSYTFVATSLRVRHLEQCGW